MSIPAFFLSPDKWSSALALTGQEARHAHVLRLNPGDAALLIDGQGKSAVCRVSAMDKKTVRLEMESETFTPRPKALPIMALAFSKATRRGFFFEKASELGADEVWLWRADRSQGDISEALAENCRGQLVAGCKQCHNPWIPRLRVLRNAAELVENASMANWRVLPWEVSEGVPMLMADQLGRPGITVYVIGPEGGFSPDEITRFQNAGFMPASLGNRVLRCETAATLCLGLHWWASQLPGHPDARGG